MHHKSFLWLRTVRHFPLASLWRRLGLKISRKFYRPCLPPDELSAQWQAIWADRQPGAETPLKEFLPSFERWQYQSVPLFQARMQTQVQQLVQRHQAELLNEHFSLSENVGDLSQALSAQTPLWQENYGYLEFLLPLILFLQSEPKSSPHYISAQTLLETQLNLFWQLSFKSRVWSTYGVSRRLLTYCELLPILTQLSPLTQRFFWRNFYQESRYLVSFLEWDIQGNHLVQNLTAWLAITIALRQLPDTQRLAWQWQNQLQHLLPQVFSQQTLADGFHYERTPMYHLWVLRDLLACLARLKPLNMPENVVDSLTHIAQKMMQAGATILHSSGQIPLFGDASLPQTPDFTALIAYAKEVAGLDCANLIPQRPFHHFSHAGFAVFHNTAPQASLIIDCGDFAPRHLPAHAHCDLGSFELHGASGPLIVDSGVSEYIPSLIRDYFRGTGAHNTIWFPDQEQAEIWGGFRVAEYPRFQGCQIKMPSVQTAMAASETGTELSPNETRLTVAYESYNGHYAHQRSITPIENRFWVVEDRVQCSATPPAEGWSLLHIHPDCPVKLQEFNGFLVDSQLLILPFGAQSVEYTNQTPWKTQHLNLYSAGFNLAKPGQLIALAANLSGPFGWVLAPYSSSNKPGWHWENNTLTLTFSDGAKFSLKLDSGGLRQCAPTPGL
jgi:hypothetical protein